MENKPREPDMYIGKGKRRRPIYFTYIGITADGEEIPGLNTDLELMRKRTDKFAAAFGLRRKVE